MAWVEHQWHIRQVVAANAPASAQRMIARKGNNDGFGCDLEVTNARAVLDRRQDEGDVQLGGSEPLLGQVVVAALNLPHVVHAQSKLDPTFDFFYSIRPESGETSAASGASVATSPSMSLLSEAAR